MSFEIDLGVEHVKESRFRHDERIDLDLRAILLDEAAIHLAKKFDRVFRLLRGEAKRLGELAPVKRLVPTRRIDGDLDDLLGRLVRHFLDLDAAFGRRHHDDFGYGAVDHDAEIKLARDVGARFDPDLVDDLAFGAGLRRDERLAHDLFRRLTDRGEILADFYPARFTAAAGMDLRLDDPDGCGDFLRGFFGARGYFGAFLDQAAVRNSDAIFFEELLALVFVNIQDSIPATAERSSSSSFNVAAIFSFENASISRPWTIL